MQIIFAGSVEKGLEKAKDILYEKVDSKTVLFLSGGKTPGKLYKMFAQEEKLHPAAVAMIDERYGPPMHTQSNEKMLYESGLLRYFHMIDVPFYPILRVQEGRQQAANAYDAIIRDLLFNFPKSIGLCGIGSDGHTAGIPVLHSEKKAENSKLSATSDLVFSHDIDISGFGNRITLSFTALSMMDFFLITAFGENKKQALSNMFEPGSLEDCPARFFNKEEISKKTVLITDQKI